MTIVLEIEGLASRRGRTPDPLSDIRIPTSWRPAYTTEAGVRKLNGVVAFLNANPQLHEQGQWITDCGIRGVRACVAGWACLLAGAKPVRGFLGRFRNPAGGLRELPLVRFQGCVGRVEDVATDLLQLQPGFANALFHGGNTLAAVNDLRALAEASTLPDFVPASWSRYGQRLPSAHTVAEAAVVAPNRALQLTTYQHPSLDRVLDELRQSLMSDA